MNRITRHLENVPIEYVCLLAAAVFVTALVTPRKHRLGLALVFLGCWLNFNRFSGLGVIASVAKISFVLPPLLVIFLAGREPGARNKVPGIAYLYLIMPFIGCFLISSTTDRTLGFLYFLNMFLLSLAGIFTYRVCGTAEKLNYFLKCLLIGLLAPLATGIIGIVFFPSLSYLPGLGRVAPFGCNPNQFVPVIALAIALAAYTLVTTNDKFFKMLCVGTISVAFALLIATGSRQGFVLALIILVPLTIGMTRKPVVLAFSAVIIVSGTIWVFGFIEGDLASTRYRELSSTSGRLETLLQYLDVIKHRPFLGLFGTGGQSIIMAQSDEIRLSTHNAYLDFLYWGGIVLAGPIYFAVLYNLRAMVNVLKRSKQLGIQPLGVKLLAALLIAIYLHGLVNQMPYVGISTWTYVHYFLSCMFLGLARDLKAPAPSLTHATYRLSQRHAVG